MSFEQHPFLKSSNIFVDWSRSWVRRPARWKFRFEIPTFVSFQPLLIFLFSSIHVIAFFPCLHHTPQSPSTSHCTQHPKHGSPHRRQQTTRHDSSFRSPRPRPQHQHQHISFVFPKSSTHSTFGTDTIPACPYYLLKDRQQVACNQTTKVYPPTKTNHPARTN
jgi:hypothetical protein